MVSTDWESQITFLAYKYRTHLFIFFITFFIGLSLAHPTVLLNDEFITTNQLHQLQAGHQILINEGKFGLTENGSMSAYFGKKANLLAYTLFYPLISLPAYEMIDLTGENCVFFILCLWTMTGIVILLMINRYYSVYSFFLGKKWTFYAIAGIFILFFINLYFYATFPVDPIENHPEVLALAFTNLILLSISGLLIYEINRTIFEDPVFSFFGAMVCLFASSYFFWATYCKDHTLVLPIVTGIFLCLVRLIKTEDYWYFPLAFLLTGLLAWARPELAFWIILFVLCITLFFFTRSYHRSDGNLLIILSAPLFTIIGALPFFLNNYLLTKNYFLPTESLYLIDPSISFETNASRPLLHTGGIRSIEGVLLQVSPNIPANPLDAFRDLFGIFFYPQTGSISVFGLTPLFITLILFAGVLFFLKKIQFTSEEKKIITLALFLSMVIFLAYTHQFHSLNTDAGIVPDVRYLSPLYLLLTITGLIILRHVDFLPPDPIDSCAKILLICIVGVPFFLVLIGIANSYSVPLYNFPIGKFFSLYTLALIVLTVLVLTYHAFRYQMKDICQYLILLLCSVPFFWQVSMTFFLRSFSGFAGYTFWIPVVRVIWELIANFIILRKIIP